MTRIELLAAQAIAHLRRVGTVRVDAPVAAEMRNGLLKMVNASGNDFNLDVLPGGIYVFRLIVTPIFPIRFGTEQ